MKTKKQLYDPPVVATMTLQTEGFICQSVPQDATAGFGWLSGTDNDLSDLFSVPTL